MPEKFKKGASVTEVHGYVPLHKRIAVLQNAGMRTMMAKDELYDNINDLVYDNSGRIIGEKLEVSPPPPLPRHVDADYADVAEHYAIYVERRRQIRQRAAEQRAKKLQGGTGGSPPVNPDDPLKKPPETEKAQEPK